MPQQPSFILFITDQQRADYLGCMGHPVLKTPNIDAIAENGMVWDKFYVASPVCMPNRASFMSCRMPSSHGVRHNGIPLDKRNVTFVEMLRAAGYKTALIGKSHLQNFTNLPPLTQPPEPKPGFSAANPIEAVRHDHQTYQDERPGKSNIATPFYGFDHVELATRHGDNLGGDYKVWLHEQRPDAENLLGQDNQLPHDYVCPQAIRTAVPEELYGTKWIADRACAWLEEHATQDQPYFLMVSFPDPHHPFNPPGKYWDMYSPEDMDIPEAFERNDWTPPPHVAGILKQREDGSANVDAQGAFGVSAREAQEAQEARALTCGMISMVDDAIGDVRAVNGADRAIQIFTSDHGDHLGDHKLLLKGAEQYEQITRVPFIWSDPDASSRGRTDKIAQTIDIGTTILDRANIMPAVGMQGISILETQRDAAFIQYDHQKYNPGLGWRPRVHSLRTNRWRITVFHNVDWGELYDLENDPGEFENLWDCPEFFDTKSELLLKFLKAEIACVDRSPAPSGFA